MRISVRVARRIPDLSATANAVKEDYRAYFTEAGCLIETAACDHDLLDADIEFAGLALVEDAGSTRGRERVMPSGAW
jgi:hypothetical protein